MFVFLTVTSMTLDEKGMGILMNELGRQRSTIKIVLGKNEGVAEDSVG